MEGTEQTLSPATGAETLPRRTSAAQGQARRAVTAGGWFVAEDLNDADDNQVVGNDVVGNGSIRAQDSGIELEKSDHNVIDDNTIRGNADGLTDGIRCQSGDHNTGNNVTRPCR